MAERGATAAGATTGIEGGSLAERALAVLRANSLASGTSPSLRLYPHQWSWDSACVAMGYARHDQERAEEELRALLAGQWRNGLLPHIVFTEGARYFPGPEFWETERSPDAPALPRTSGIVQPPLHATAALRVYRGARDEGRARAFLAELFPRLVAWHGYLYRERTRSGDGLVEIWHPWESGMDNSPLWDEALARIALGDGDVPAYQRVDVEVTDAAERPSNRDYDRYAYLVGLFRGLRYRPERVREATPFAVQPVLFNSLLAAADHDLAEIARIVGADPGPIEGWARLTSAGLEKLWDESLGLYLDFDVRSGRHVETWCSAGLAPLYAGAASPTRAARMLERLGDCGLPIGGDGWAATSLPPSDPRFVPTLYWRGPVWPILNWVLFHGLARYGYAQLAGRIRAGVLALAEASGFWEHYDPLTGRGHGGEQFAWTAALVLDLLSTQTSHPRMAATTRKE